MDTIIREISDTIEDAETFLTAGEIIKNGGLVAFPTETVYGLGGDALNPASSQKIYAAKGRPSDNPLIVHIACMEDLPAIVKEIPDTARKLADAFWPGPLTMIFEKSDLVPKETTGGLETVAVRMPSDPAALAFIKEAGGYVAAPSANLSGKPSPTSAKYVEQDMLGRIDMILDGGDVEIGLESTIVDLTSENPMILRPGYVTKEMLEAELGLIDLDKTMMNKDTGAAPKAPGMKYRHYAPKGDLSIVEGEDEKVVSYINVQTALLEAEGAKVGIIATDENQEKYCAKIIMSAGSKTREEMIAHELYRILREFDDLDVTYIYAESFDTSGMGQAIMNRLLKAAGHKVVHV
ncbi:MAG: threonylcarbamoyl-AMP synthase [Lachnospiraceae bacterium]|nr:threonylcarbamoyl-AMP synthase [Lachnospiraceae bacterium]